MPFESAREIGPLFVGRANRDADDSSLAGLLKMASHLEARDSVVGGDLHLAHVVEVEAACDSSEETFAVGLCRGGYVVIGLHCRRPLSIDAHMSI